MAKKYRVDASATFERTYRKLITKHPEVRALFSIALSELEENPTSGHGIKKLIGVRPGYGEWRIRIGAYRIRYDIYGMVVELHTIGPRKDIYRNL